MPSNMTYTTYVDQLANMLVMPTNDPGFVAMLPGCINDAEQMIYRELDPLGQVKTDTTTFTANNRNLTLPTNLTTQPFLVINQINVITPSTTTNPNLGVRNAVTPVSKAYLDFTWPDVTGATVPKYYAMITQTSIIVGPWPDTTYTVEVVGVQRPAVLSATNTTTLLTMCYPDLFFAASMIFASAFQKNFGGSGADDPRMPGTWKSHYDALLQSARVEETRKRYNTGLYGSVPPTPIKQVQ